MTTRKELQEFLAEWPEDAEVKLYIGDEANIMSLCAPITDYNIKANKSLIVLCSLTGAKNDNT